MTNEEQTMLMHWQASARIDSSSAASGWPALAVGSRLPRDQGGCAARLCEQVGVPLSLVTVLATSRTIFRYSRPPAERLRWETRMLRSSRRRTRPWPRPVRRAGRALDRRCTKRCSAVSASLVPVGRLPAQREFRWFDHLGRRRALLHLPPRRDHGIGDLPARAPSPASLGTLPAPATVDCTADASALRTRH
jgi:hypothetical protein